MTWTIVNLHVLPVDDLREHVADLNCWCHPTPDADDEDVVVHHSADRREEYERGELKLQ